MIDRLMTDASRFARLSRSARLTATVIDMIADDEFHPSRNCTGNLAVNRPGSRSVNGNPRDRLPPPAQTFRRQVRPSVAPQQPAAQSTTYPFITRPVGQPADTTRSMRTVLTDLQERPNIAPSDIAHGEEGGEDADQDGGQDDLTIPEWPKSSAKQRRRRFARHAGSTMGGRHGVRGGRDQRYRHSALSAIRCARSGIDGQVARGGEFAVRGYHHTPGRPTSTPAPAPVVVTNRSVKQAAGSAPVGATPHGAGGDGRVAHAQPTYDRW